MLLYRAALEFQEALTVDTWVFCGGLDMFL